MKKLKNKYIVLFFIALFLKPVFGQYLPKDGSKLNYNQIYFEYPFNENADFYKIHIAYDSIQSKDDFESYTVQQLEDKTPATRVEGFLFGKKYKWYVETVLKSGEKLKSETHVFSILSSIYTDTAKYKVKQNYYKQSKIIDGLIWCDHIHCALNRKGDIVWFIPGISIDFKENRTVRDFRLQNDGTITFLSEPEAYHIDREMNILWKGPNNGKVTQAKEELYHHSFEKLNNGNYMTLGNDVVELERTDTKDSTSNIIELATLIEYDSEGKIVWFWKMRDHFPFDLLASEKDNIILNPHCNSFSIDKTGNSIYLGFRDISRIIKIDKGTKKIVASYGKKLNAKDTSIFETDIFRHPHDIKILDNDKILLLNNNDLKPHNNVSSTELFRLPKRKGEKFVSLWSFKFNFDTINNGRSVKLGGNQILENGNMLINEGVINRIVEVNKNKEILWDLITLKKDSVGKWKYIPQYRVNFSKSLYPYVFSHGIINHSKEDFNLIIFNEGDYIDSYLCEIYDLQGKLILTKIISALNPNSQKQIKINLVQSESLVLKLRSIKSGLIKEIKIK